MTNALAPLSILLSFAMGLVAFDDPSSGVLFGNKVNAGFAGTHDSRDSPALGHPITIASKPPGARFFFLAAEVNGVETRFLVDTGATTTVLRSSDAGAAAVVAGAVTRLHTANGKVAVGQASIDRLTISGIVLSDVQAVVADDRVPHSLIGLDVLERMGRIVIDGSSIKVF
ncbi:retropepsin-like aspartic protease family protein [Aurantiacibacter suaedae]|uniref:retropepsin-like aspartic protease family protein n=1 Tax=Aurantiacibacter suaedae TaxID=2545755 RepID=UPI0010F616CC|nr:retropepsin-like aspartic protease [Aurantiacibacter suaedae]